MKISTLIAQYLYLYKKLDVEGIGSFYLDESAVVPGQEYEKQKKAYLLEGVRFEQNTSLKTDDDLIRFIAEQTGKMKPLANADLTTHLELVRQFLNIGKPFLLEGIGSLTKLKSGQFVFTPGFVVLDKIKESVQKDAASPYIMEEVANTEYNPFLEDKKDKFGWKKPVIGFLIIALLGIAIWGGYTLYERKMEEKPVAITEKNSSATTQAPSPLTATAVINNDTVIDNKLNSDLYKFVFEVADSLRAYTRFEKLKSFQWNIQLEKSGANHYKLFYMLASSDTTRTIDSLKIVYGKKPWIEKL